MWKRDLKIGRVDSSGCEKSLRSPTRKEWEEENIKEEGLLYISFSIYLSICVCDLCYIRKGHWLRPVGSSSSSVTSKCRSHQKTRHMHRAIWERKEEKQQQLVQQIIRPLQSAAALTVALVYSCTCNNVIHSRKSNCWMRFTGGDGGWLSYTDPAILYIHIYVYRTTKTL
jgi:hypothetical protein